jgi:hypothetical protein
MDDLEKPQTFLNPRRSPDSTDHGTGISNVGASSARMKAQPTLSSASATALSRVHEFAEEPDFAEKLGLLPKETEYTL